ncbi:cytochrome c biogenesis protein CcdA [Sodaliphilus sp.]|uniref:protein-disulfide reductase DsbD family protein n=1 Tax=Sodaliphilus sp. TaxID=2815818 RepID=UPI00389054F2
MKRQYSILLILLLATFSLSAQIVTPVKWKTSVKMNDDKHGVVVMQAKIDNGWHMYATELPDGGPVATSVEWSTLNGVKLDGKLTWDNKPVEKHDKSFDMTLKWWEKKVTLSQAFVVTGEEYEIKGTIRYMACDDQQCSAPETEQMSFKGKPDAPADTANTALDSATVALGTTQTTNPAGDTWAPVKVDNGVVTGQTGSSSLWLIFIACFGGGLLALLTPCVWPIIPMTVSFFLKKSGSRAKSIKNAVIYGLSIIIIYVSLGLVVTAIFGPSMLNAIATNAVCNIIFFALLVVFALSFFGAFEIKLPESWSNKIDSKAEQTTGLLSIFFMAFTLAIVSFSCTGPIIGTLLVEAASQGSGIAPAVGMLGFAIALAIPFTIFALFPSMLKKMPKSGGWMNTVKVLLGFIELALSLKFLSVADLAYGWHILDREVFLALWIAIFLMLGLYLLGIFRFSSDGESSQPGVGVTRAMLGLVALAFTAYLIPGLWGAPLRATSAFVPPLYTQDFNLYGEELVEWDDFDKGLEAAERSGKPVFVDFSGYGCVNCRKMDGAVLDVDEVKTLISKEFVTVKLMVDDKAPLEKVITVEENGKSRELTTKGDLWSYLQRHKFNANSQPYYVVLNSKGELLSGPFTYDENVAAFKDFLNKGLNNAK